MTADRKGMVGHAGAVLLWKLADRTDLTRELAGVLPTSTAASWRERAAVLIQLAVTIALGARSLLESEQLQLHHQGLFGPAASESRWLRFVRRRLGAMFPYVPQQPGWNKRLRAALPLVKPDLGHVSWVSKDAVI